MTTDMYNDITFAGHILCQYCESKECNSCMVNRLLDDAYIEAVESGIINGIIDNDDEDDNSTPYDDEEVYKREFGFYDDEDEDDLDLK